MEVWFYHLQSQPLSRALPALLEKALERGWRAVVQTIDAAVLKAVDDMLWAYKPESFLPHGVSSDKNADRQPILVTCEAENLNAAALRLYVGTAEVEIDPAASAYERVILMFDGRDDDELAGARRQWSRLKGQGFTLAYWQQTDEGRWERRL